MLADTQDDKPSYIHVRMSFLGPLPPFAAAAELEAFQFYLYPLHCSTPRMRADPPRRYYSAKNP